MSLDNARAAYPILVRLADREIVQACWEEDEPSGRPRRHLYRLTSDGLSEATFLFWASLTLWLGVRALRGPSAGRMLAVGLGAAAAYLTRPEGLELAVAAGRRPVAPGQPGGCPGVLQADDVPAVGGILARELEADAAVRAGDEDCRHQSWPVA